MTPARRRPAEAADEGVAIDDVDKAIIRALQVDGRTSYAKLGPEVGLSQAAVRQRVQRLIENGVMQVVAVTDPLTLGFTIEAMIGVQVDGDVRVVATQLADIPQVDYVVVTAGRYDVLLEALCEDTEHLMTLLNDTIRAIDGVRHAEASTYLHLEKQTYAWGTR